MYQVISYKEKSIWNHELKGIFTKDIFSFHSYNELYQTMGDGNPYLFIYNDGFGRKVYYTFFKRRINSIPIFSENDVENEIFDIITSPYGYGGPLTDYDDKDLIIQFRREFEEYCQKENIISEFVRFNPVLKNNKNLDESMDIIYDRETVFLDLRKSEEEIMREYHKNHRRNINKGRNYELEFRVFENEEAIKKVDEFYVLYRETMNKLGASAYSYFSTDYIVNLLSGLNNNSLIGTVYYKGKMISAALCLYEGGILHYHLGCSKKELSNTGTNIFLLHNVALWGKQNSCHTFHLGGGHVGRDSLFQFKHRFSQSGVLDFFIGRKIHNHKTYNILLQQLKKHYSIENSISYFPAYRYIPSNSLTPIG